MVGKTVTRKTLKRPINPPANTAITEYYPIILMAVAVFLLLCLISYDPRDPSFNVATNKPGISNLCGLLGSHIADAIVQLFGKAALLLPCSLIFFSVRLFRNQSQRLRWSEVGATLAIISALACLIQRITGWALLRYPLNDSGGAVGGFLHASFYRYFGTVGELLFCVTILIVAVLYLSRTPLREIAKSKPAVRMASIPARISEKIAAMRRRSNSEAPSGDAPLMETAGAPLKDSTHEVNATFAPMPADEEPPKQIVKPAWEKLDFTSSEYKIIDCDNLFIEEEEYDRSKVASQKAVDLDLPIEDEVRKQSQADDNIEVDRPAIVIKANPIDPQIPRYEAPLEEAARAPRITKKYDEDCPNSQIDADSSDVEDNVGVENHKESVSETDLEAAINDYLSKSADNIAATVQDEQEKVDDQVIEASPAIGKAPDRQALSRDDQVQTADDQPPSGPESEPQNNPTINVQGIKVVPRADDPEPEVVNPVSVLSALKPYTLPPSELLDVPPESDYKIDEDTLRQNASILEQKLMDLGVKGSVVEIHPGPVITMYEITLAPGIPLRRVINMSDDLAMALKSGSTRVVAPIPGKDTVGIEVPNLKREIVYFRDIVESKAFRESGAPLKMALGKGIDGEPFTTSLTRMPHLLIAGATGTGKSVGLNCLICSWLMSCSPDDVRFLMVDPKKLELSYYQDIPHLLHPVVTEAEKVPKVLSWAIREMERRYDLLSEAGAKNIDGYNQLLATGKLYIDPENPPTKLPYIIIMIDELAELMMVAAKDIEISIARLAQMARAAGIHLILATQRPSVDVITGIIKANFPARLSYQVSAKPDSRTILDTTGAEHLLGMGDMLFLPPGSAKLRRLHGAYVSENEIRRIVDFIKTQRSPVYLQEITKHVTDCDTKSVGSDLIDDVKYDEAVELVTRIGHASISLIQRHMRIGYNRAARIIEAMESEGIIGPSDGTSRPREVLTRSLESVPDM